MDIFGAEFDPSRPSMQGLPFLSPMKDLLSSLPDDKPVKTRKSRRTLVLMKNGQDEAGNEDGVGNHESDAVAGADMKMKRSRCCYDCFMLLCCSELFQNVMDLCSFEI